MFKRTPSGSKNAGSQIRSNTKNITSEDMYKMIRVRAYEVYCKRGNTPGDATSDWLKAERLVKRELGLAR